jgi:protein tyrosine kinase modulator
MGTEFEEPSKTLRDYLIILKRHRKRIVISTGTVVMLTVFFALSLPASYRSTATILIEEQEIPRDLVRSTISGYAAQQIQVITKRVMTLDNIQRIVEKFGLYAQGDTKLRRPRTEIAEQFVRNVNLDLVSADVIDPRSGRPSEATIAFTLSVDDRDPLAAQQVATELVDLYLNENRRAREVKASGAADFLAAEAATLNAELEQRESEIAKFKEVSEGALPELYQFNLSIVERTERELSDVSLRIQELNKRKIQLSAELTQLSPSAPVVLASGQVVLSDVDRLRALTSQYRKKTAIYRDSHPDIKRLLREIKTLQSDLGVVESRLAIQQQLQTQREELVSLQRRYAVGHPKVLNAELVVKQLEKTLNRAIPLMGAEQVPDNPSYVLLDTQLKATAAEIESLNIKKNILRKKLSQYEALIKKAPGVEKDYQALMRDYKTAGLKFQEIKAKLREAEMAKNLEHERKGERFVVLEPPALPLTPFSPNRLGIILMGFILAITSGVVYVALLEAMDHSIRGSKALTKVMGEPPYVVIPYLDNSMDSRQQSHQRTLTAYTVGSVLMSCVIYTHFYFKPLSVLWFDVLQKAGLG